ncbi:tRNA uracil 4-sulfurtransferase ThiI [Aciduricibacillus chroicocephali]|uniref:Probable tRNA sulfurtransferase n=1 Tax=Aciduricibacillus chroicocephali TaxID=3054939 RepID=A0ABY9KTA9_9BACI|nr:tRNA uracil 4-sulfurtransferase ThiI [Bacillaceae bacterium 44XB]
MNPIQYEFDHILIRYGELGIKGKNIRKFLVKLQENIQHQLHDFQGVKVRATRGRLFVLLNGQAPEPIMEKLENVFGIKSLSLAVKTENDPEQIKDAALQALLYGRVEGTFKVDVKRTNKGFPVRSQDMNQVLGAHLLQNTEHFTVDLHHPDIHMKVEIRDDATYITTDARKGLGGLPVGTSGKSLLLLSGGIDSPVAGYLAMKRGVSLEAIHFHSPPYTSERAKQKVIDLAEKLTAFGHDIKIHLVPFTELQQEIFKQIPDYYAMTAMRRVMLRISEQICRKRGILSMTTGESLGQVASQTMDSMHVINAVTSYPIIRPLVAMDKEEIIEIAEKIDTYPISIRPYEDCCTIFVPKSPKTKPRLDKMEYFESQADFSELIKSAIENAETISARQIKQEKDELADLF